MSNRQLAFIVLVAMLLVLGFFWFWYKPDTRVWNTILLVDIILLFIYCFFTDDLP